MKYILLFFALFLGLSFFRWIIRSTSLADESKAISTPPAAKPPAEITTIVIPSNPDEGIQESDAVREFHRRAVAGDRNGQRLFGEALFLGKEIPQDYLKSLYWFLKSAAQGCSEAQMSIGYIYDEGYGIPKNSKVAMQWYVKAAENGSDLAQAIVSSRRIAEGSPKTRPMAFGRVVLPDLNDDGTPIQSDAVLEFRRRACAGERDGQRMLGESYLAGRGIMQDFDYAMHWFLKAANQGSSDAQFFIGGMHEGGHGVPKNSLVAMTWYVKAASNGSLAAQTILANRMA
jgi:TPR repeat protein